MSRLNAAGSEILSNNVPKTKQSGDEITPKRNVEVCAGRKGNKISLKRLGNCEVCAVNAARYTCPKCEVKTCSVPCVQIHKRELSCDGKRDRTKFVQLQHMSEQEFRSDYYFLEECTRFVADRKRDPNKRYTNQHREMPHFLKRLQNKAKERTIKLLFLLQNFSRHTKNTTFYDCRKRKIFWRVEWIFTNAGDLKYIDERCDEDVPLVLLLDKYVNAKSGPERKALIYYQSVGVAGIKLFLKAEWVKRSQTRYYELDASKSLKENLAGKTIVEFPTIHLTYEKNPTYFEVVDSDEDIESELKSYNDYLKKLQEKQEATNDGGQDSNKPLKKNHLKRKRTTYDIESSNNFLFTDEKLLDELSTSSSEAEQEENETKLLYFGVESERTI